MSNSIESTRRNLLTIKQAADFLNVSVRSVWRLIEDNKLRARKIGRSTRIAVKDLEDLIDDA